MIKKKIFLSYRRGDRPGYVARLQDELEHHFGDGRAFRDVDDIEGGTSWRLVIEQNLQEAGALLLIIGPNWESIWKARQSDPENYVAYELEYAKRLGIPIIPVTLGGTEISYQLDLGSLSWLREKQAYDISDKQGRWKSDIAGLIRLLEKIESIGQVVTTVTDKPQNISASSGGSRKVIWAVAAFLIIGVGFYLFDRKQESDIGSFRESNKTILAQAEPKLTQPLPDVASVQIPKKQTITKRYPDINGTWKSQVDDTLYIVSQKDDGSFTVISPGYANGSGRFLANMPRKFEVSMVGVGRGEFSVSHTDDRIVGWFLDTETNQQMFDTLIKVK
ncbi:MAG: toll/interleukin-1 receptor domain-containing protein [Candidatus Thiodiazotropha sp. (ex Lucinoma borealis)]|nr:toll/interleukin-1 receptor domain-containing protein [Candidatus Thiodiazotropha sp. (ex Lucinoma borealis)]MCU7855229.1 toll/interleukin-1 receptor domain-containing protein [Candidatus Thiodiazotropha sp. (ex Lucinoma borealis)]MCU7870369.1 toll/interleukin-1 receptor domain-containing protein [Candidatus Thiodiazotropha sp. (ex Lucinoma borealis)]